MFGSVEKTKRALCTLIVLSGLSAVDAYAADPDCNALSSHPVYWVVNPTTKVSLLTPWENEYESAAKYGFTDRRGVIFSASVVPATGLAGAHRMYNPATGSFFWTISESEVASAIRNYGYVDNGINFYVSPVSSACTQPVYRLNSGSVHRFVASQTEYNHLINAGWTGENIKFFAGGTKSPGVSESPAPLGVNVGVDGVKDWASELMFADAIKMARPFGTVASGWDEKNYLPASRLTADGWPTVDAGILVMSVNQDTSTGNAHQSGIYKLLFKGTVTPQTKVKANGSLVNYSYNSASQSYTADINYDNTANLYLTFEGFTGGVRDVRLIRPGHTTADVFEKNFVQRVNANNNMFGILRFMEGTATNGLGVAKWSDRTPKNYATQQKQFSSSRSGISWEYVIELANLTGKDPWINIPHLADDDYVEQLAILLKNNLNSERKIYIEYSNEIWNTAVDLGFTQNKDISKAACDKVVLSGDPDNYFGGLSGNKADCRTQGKGFEYAYLGRHSAWKLKRIGDIFKKVFGDSAMITRIRPVLAWDVWGIATRNGSTAGTIADQLQYLNNRYGAPSKYIYGVAIGAYVDLQKRAGDPQAPTNMNLSVDEIFDRMAEHNRTFYPARFSSLRAVANQYGLKMFAYEGGQGLYGPVNYNNKRAAQTDPRMKSIVKTLLQTWKDAGGDTFVYYGLVSSYANHGFWGLSSRLDDENSIKWQALKEKAAEWNAVRAQVASNVTGQAFDSAVVTASAKRIEPLAEDLGKTGAFYLFANSSSGAVLILDPGTGWQSFAGCNAAPAITTGTLQAWDFPVLPVSNDPVTVDMQVYYGYGLGEGEEACNEMLATGRFVVVSAMQ